MLRVLGSRRTLCDGLTRREMLRAGGLGLFGLALGDLRVLQKASAAEPSRPALGGFGRAKRCILLYLYGAPSQLETFDLKPDAPSEVRSQFRPAPTVLPGVQVCEHLPRTAAILDRCTLVRSMTHPYNIHSAAYTLTGVPTTDIPMELNPRDARHWPCFGSVLDSMRCRRGERHDLPYQVALPWKFSTRSEPFRRGGPYGGFLGSGFDPVWGEFVGDAPKGDPYRAVTPQGRFEIGQSGVPELTLDRLDRRRSLLEQLDAEQRRLDGAARDYDRPRRMAFDLVSSPKLGHALDLDKEAPPRRERYGMTLFGQATLAARRLLEAGVPLVTVIWDEFKDANTAWDTHIDQVPRLKDELLPGFDLAYSALILDLEERGLLDETLVLCLTEHGRTPKLNNARGGGREHWSWAYCGLFAGGGIKRGTVVGATDREAGYPKQDPVSPKDVLRTVYHLLGVDAETHLTDREGRPVPLVSGGEVVRGLLA